MDSRRADAVGKVPFISPVDGTIWYMDTMTGVTEHPCIHVNVGLDWLMQVCQTQLF